jgi:hypothetical protein
MNSVTYAAERGFAMGAKYGLVKGFRAYHSTEATPEMDETAMQGAIGIIIAVGGVLIALYIIAVVVGSISYAVTSGNIKLSPTWNSTITKSDQVENENRRFIGREYRFAGTGDVQPRKCSAYRHNWSGDSHDCDWSLPGPRHLNLMPSHNISYRTSNIAIA